MFIISLQAGLIVKLLMKLSGQITPNDKSATDKYAYGWKTVEETTAAIDPSAGYSYRLSFDCNTPDVEQSLPLSTSASFCIFGLLISFTTSHGVFWRIFWVHVNMFI